MQIDEEISKLEKELEQAIKDEDRLMTNKIMVQKAAMEAAHRASDLFHKLNVLKHRRDNEAKN